MDANQIHAKESASCPMDFILRMLMGPWTTYISTTQDPWPAALRRAEAARRGHLGQDADRAAAHARRRVAGARDYEATIPPKVTYSLTQRGHELDDVLGKLADIGMRWEAEDAALRAVRAAELKAAE